MTYPFHTEYQVEQVHETGLEVWSDVYHNILIEMQQIWFQLSQPSHQSDLEENTL